ncbi:MAG: hypothetical protein DYG89_14795 [Caldilinea sp. CFX5]|nr:hypothetical protein [Caldilinea sp. CFX5]
MATIANATIVLYNWGWQGAPLTAELWAALLVYIAAVIGFFFALRPRDAAYTLVLVWAFVGIYIAQNDAPLTAYSALVMAGMLAGVAFTALFLGRRSHEPMTTN